MSRLNCGQSAASGAVTHFQHECVYARLCVREGDVVFVCGTMCAADAAIFISHSWRPRKCSVSWLTVIFSVSACLPEMC